ncbi:MAG: nicotinate phosphoribosyltransferase [Atopobiaceae bacterium]|nr:nicotinate phosphoribosyltransferase [Atopobiaceae bacterium]
MALTDRTVPTDVALNTDLYELTMAQGFWESGLVDAQGCFNVFFRENPFGGGYAVACGVGQIAELVENLRFDEESIAYLASVKAPGGGPMFKEGFLDYLRDFRLHVDVWAIPEGDLAFPREPMVRVQGSIIECQLLETALLNLVNFQTLVATKASRVVYAAEGHPVSDFGLRRAQGHDGGLAVARASYIGGCGSTSNVLAGKIYGIPVFGTHAHSWVMAFPTELDAFRAFAKSSPKNCCLLLDTYDVRQGIKNAIIVAKEMEAAGERLSAIRIDSGDLARLSKETRAAFDEAGLPYVKISVSNDLEEYTIQSLFAQGAPIDTFGVGTKLATCDPQPALGGVYKLSATRGSDDEPWRPVMKLSEQVYKRTIPGVQRVLRFEDASGCPVGDMIVDDACDTGNRTAMVDLIDPVTVYRLEGYTSRELLQHIVADGRRVGELPTIAEAKARCKDAIMHLDPATKRFLNPQTYPVGLERGLSDLRQRLASEEASVR